MTLLHVISSDTLVVTVCDSPPPAAGTICRYDGFCLQGAPPPNANVTYFPIVLAFAAI